MPPQTIKTISARPSTSAGLFLLSMSSVLKPSWPVMLSPIVNNCPQDLSPSGGKMGSSLKIAGERGRSDNLRTFASTSGCTDDPGERNILSEINVIFSIKRVHSLSGDLSLMQIVQARCAGKAKLVMTQTHALIKSNQETKAAFFTED
jgi:hypothetical protein